MNQDEEFKQQIQANDYGGRMSEFDQYKKWKDEHDPLKTSTKVFCPNCEKDIECTHVAELYECDECGEDFAKYIVGRTKPSNSDVSMTENVLPTIKTKEKHISDLIAMNNMADDNKKIFAFPISSNFKYARTGKAGWGEITIAIPNNIISNIDRYVMALYAADKDEFKKYKGE